MRTNDALQASFVPLAVFPYVSDETAAALNAAGLNADSTRWVYRFGDLMQYTLEFEPMIGGGYDVGLYHQRPDEPWPMLMLSYKVPVLPVGEA
jgi:hypothetical protein